MSAYRDLIAAEAGLLGYWPLGVAGPAMPDVSGLGHAGTVINGVTTQQPGLLAVDPTELCVVGQNGSTEIDIAGGSFHMDGNTPFSAEAWVKDLAVSGTRYIMGCHVAGGTNGWGVRRSSAGDSILLLRNDGTTNSSITAGGLSTVLSKRTHIVATYDGSTPSGLRLYINGVLAVGPGGQALVIPAAAASLVIGNSSVGDGNGFIGGIQHVALYNYALAAATVQNHYDVGRTAKAAATLSGHGDLAGPLKRVKQVRAALSGHGDFTIPARRAAVVRAALAGRGDLVANLQHLPSPGRIVTSDQLVTTLSFEEN